MSAIDLFFMVALRYEPGVAAMPTREKE